MILLDSSRCTQCTRAHSEPCCEHCAGDQDLLHTTYHYIAALQLNCQGSENKKCIAKHYSLSSLFGIAQIVLGFIQLHITPENSIARIVMQRNTMQNRTYNALGCSAGGSYAQCAFLECSAARQWIRPSKERRSPNTIRILDPID